MYPISDAVKALFAAEQRQMLRITGYGSNGQKIRITDDDIILNSFSIDRYACNESKLEIGTAISSEMMLKLYNYDGRFDYAAFEGAELFVEIGIADWEQDEPEITWIPCGYFTPDRQPRKLGVITLNALDRMMRFDQVVERESLVPWEDNNGNTIKDNNNNTIYFFSGITFPTTLPDFVESICTRYGVPLATDLTQLPNATSYEITAFPVTDVNLTYRQIIQWCAGVMGANAWIDWNGEMRFSWYDNTTSYVTNTSNRYNSDLYENDITVTGVVWTDTDEDETQYVAGNSAYALDLTGNPMINADNARDILGSIHAAIIGFTYRPFEASVINAPYLWPMDRVSFVDKDGNGHVSSLTNVRFGINGAMAIAATGETEVTNSRTQPGSFTSQQQEILRRMVRVTGENLNQAVDNATAQITGANGGYVRFIYDTNGNPTEILIMDTTSISTARKVWRWNRNGLGYSSNGYNGPYEIAMTQDGAIVAKFITSGTMSADRIQGGTLVLGGNNNVSGILRILDANGTVIGSWDKNGIVTDKGTIGSFTLDNGALTYGDIPNNRAGVEISRNNIIYQQLYTGGNYGRVRIYGQGIQFYWNGNLSYTIGNYGSAFTISRVQSDGTTRGLSLNETDLSATINGYTSFKCNGLYVNNGNPVTLWPDVTCQSDFTVVGTKSRKVSTDQYSDRLLYCYETPSPMFGDVGEGEIGADGRCYVWLDAVFAQTISTDGYQVFLQRYGAGDCWVAERRPGYFIVEGEPGLRFGWEIKAKQRDYDQRRLDTAEQPYTPTEMDYGALAAAHIDDIRKERISA